MKDIHVGLTSLTGNDLEALPREGGPTLRSWGMVADGDVSAFIKVSNKLVGTRVCCDASHNAKR